VHRSPSFRFSASTVVVASSLLCAAALLLGAAGCSATDDEVGFGEGGGGSGVGGGNEGGGLLLGGNTGTGGGISSCTDPGCIGATPQGGCDGALAMDSGDGLDGARAMGLCQMSTGDTWGVVSARYVRSDGIELTDPALQIGRGILNGFGPLAAREGSQMLVLSSGTARTPSDAGYMSVGGTWKDFNPHGAPPGYPKESPACPGVVTGAPYDSAGLELVVKTPTDAKSFTFNLNFYTYEFPNYICSQFNDFFVALLTPTPAGLTDANISFDAKGNLISVNAGFLEVCNPQVASNGQPFACAAGPAELSGTGYDEQAGGSAATGWLQTTAPIDAPGSDITLRFAIWDSGDGVLDSTILLDNFKFESTEGTTGTVPVPK